MNELELLNKLAKLKVMRSADRANARSMLRKSKRGSPLNYQERQNLWAYAVRYGVAESGQDRTGA